MWKGQEVRAEEQVWFAWEDSNGAETKKEGGRKERKGVIE